MSFLEKLKLRARKLKQQLGAVYYVSRDKRVGLLPKLIIGVTLLYALSPIDLIPDFIPILGYLDDLIIVPALLGLAIRLIPKEIWKEAEERAQRDPVVLAKNWTFAVLFVLAWLAVAWWGIGEVVGLLKGNP